MQSETFFNGAGVLKGVREVVGADVDGNALSRSWSFADDTQAARHAPMFAADLTKEQRDKLTAVLAAEKGTGA